MRVTALSRLLSAGLPACVFVSAIAGCARGPGAQLIALPSRGSYAEQSEHQTSVFKNIYSFGYAPDGDLPFAGLTYLNGMLFGTTFGGGTEGNGTLFEITPAGKETVLYRFTGGADGSGPYAGLTLAGGLLYGTTTYGGANHGGTVFVMTTSGAPKTLYAFKGDLDGAAPEANLTNIDGTLYGTTAFGGGSNTACNGGCGTVFKITTSGHETVLHRFRGGADGSFPKASLIDVNGPLYGTTEFGGAAGFGTVFKIARTGAKTGVYSFKGPPDGETPPAALTNVDGILYGTAGGGSAKFGGDGVVFDITKAGIEKVLYSFKGGPDGSDPGSGLTNVGGVLYGTLEDGGQSNNGSIFKITTAGKKTLLHEFSGDDGAVPEASLIDVNGTLYGTTSSGGATSNGSVFLISP
jgi:uncharacterized repeat protein (TIGR03803 family)